MSDLEVKTQYNHIMNLKKTVSALFNWNDTQAWTWIATPLKSLEFRSPAEMVIDGKLDELDDFVNGMVSAFEDLKLAAVPKALSEDSDIGNG